MLLEVRGLYKAFKGNQVLSDINFDVKKGEIVSLLGQSGAGKTTIIRCITGLERPDRGSIAICAVKLRARCPMPLKRSFMI